MKISKKAQTATEYLVILAVVIVIALVIVSIMGGIPGIGKSGQDKAEQVFWSTVEIGLPLYTNSQTGGMTVQMKNSLREGITIDSFSLDGTDVLNAPSGIYVEAGETRLLPLSGTPACTAGQTFSYLVEINYTTTAGHSYTFTGFGHKISGTCGN
jgi:hypothetical protein